MPWVKIDEKFYQHPKVVEVGPLGMAMQVAALCYCNQNLTDGFVPYNAADTLLPWKFLGEDTDRGRKLYRISVSCGMHGEDATAGFVIELLLDAGMWEEVDGGYQIHDFKDYQPTKEEVLAERDRKKEAGRLGGLAKAEAHRLAKP